MHEVHDAVMVVVVVDILGGIHRQHEVVGSQPIPLCVSVTENTRLQHLIITVPNACTTNSWPVQHRYAKALTLTQLKILIPVGTAMIMIAAVKQAHVSSCRPTTNM